MNSDLVVEALVGHVFVDLAAGVAFAENEALEVDVEGFLHYGMEGLLELAGGLRGRVVGGEDAGDFVLEDGEPGGGVLGVAFDAVQPPPDGVAAVEAGRKINERWMIAVIVI
ncbi:hypothetical protein TcasGA2_TC012165 [Tribolium castaneum]|uniref:Uncharacterized protein n=1 Tax=Tribolium castaneum TaxID=7070 RepID=D6X0Q1_TRICA|nr:hypothetical protein TcasGA2_TC012165 [Tribolium castaneum]